MFECQSVFGLRAHVSAQHVLSAALAISPLGCTTPCDQTSSLSSSTFNGMSVQARTNCAAAAECDFSRVSDLTVSFTSEPCFEPDGSLSVSINETAAQSRGASSNQTVDLPRGDADCHCNNLIVDQPAESISFADGITVTLNSKVALTLQREHLPQSMTLELPADRVITADTELVLRWSPADAAPPKGQLDLCGIPEAGDLTCADNVALEVLEMGAGRQVVRIPEFRLGLEPGKYLIGADWRHERDGKCGALDCAIRAEATMRVEVDIK